jgi:succinate dehydrogenase/fumarate reductase flavoprotein subunit
MRYPLLLLVVGLATGCAVRSPAVVPMREQQFRSHDQAVGLPLDAAARGEVASFLEHGGNRFGPNAVPDAQAAGHRQILDALAAPGNLKIRADLATSDFCAIAAPLCQAAPIFRKRIAVTQVIDARNREPNVPDPIAVCDEEYCWIFRQAGNLLTHLVVVRSVRRLHP